MARIRRSNLLRSKLKEYCINLKMDTVRPVIDCKTRWNSTYDMMENGLRLKVVLIQVISNDAKFRKFELALDEWDIISNCKDFLMVRFFCLNLNATEIKTFFMNARSLKFSQLQLVKVRIQPWLKSYQPTMHCLTCLINMFPIHSC